MARGRKKEDSDDLNRRDPFAEGVNDAAERLEEFISILEEKELAKAEIQEEIREVYKELGGMGYEAPVVRRVLAVKKKKRQNHMKYEREEAVFETYCRALGLIDY